jgi:hypothetical protein
LSYEGLIWEGEGEGEGKLEKRSDKNCTARLLDTAKCALALYSSGKCSPYIHDGVVHYLMRDDPSNYLSRRGSYSDLTNSRPRGILKVIETPSELWKSERNVARGVRPKASIADVQIDSGVFPSAFL